MKFATGTRVLWALAASLLSGCGSWPFPTDDTHSGVIFQIDPPNWEIEEAKLPNDHVHLSLRMKRYYAGGAGEARAVFERRVQELMRTGGYTGYLVLQYNEGMESSMLGSRRIATGVVQFTGKPLG